MGGDAGESRASMASVSPTIGTEESPQIWTPRQHLAICIIMLMFSSGAQSWIARKMVDVQTLLAKASHRLIPSVASVFLILMIAAKTSTWCRLPLATRPPPMSRLVLRIFRQRFFVDSLLTVAEWMAGNFSVGARKGRVHAVENTPPRRRRRQTQQRPMIRDSVPSSSNQQSQLRQGPLIV